MGLIELQNPRIRAMLFDERGYKPLHFERNCLTDDYYVKLVFLTRRHKFVLRPGLMHLMTCRLKNERARGQQTLIPSGTENHCHNEFCCSKNVRRGEGPMKVFLSKNFCGQPNQICVRRIRSHLFREPIIRAVLDNPSCSGADLRPSRKLCRNILQFAWLDLRMTCRGVR